MESILDKAIVLSLNSAWQAIGQVTVRKSIEDMTSMSAFGDAPKLGVDVVLEDDGETLAYCMPCEWDEWIKLPIRPGDIAIQTHRFQIKAPTVVICRSYAKIPPRTPHLNSSAIFERDGYVCQYCGKRFDRQHLNLDHVIPQDPRYGGKTTWDNIVCSCKSCNTRKANRLPNEAGMNLLKRPKAPGPRPVTFDFNSARHPTWRPFLHHIK